MKANCRPKQKGPAPTLNRLSRALDQRLLEAVNNSSLPLRVVELQLLQLLNAVQEKLRAEEAAEAALAEAEAAREEQGETDG